MKSSDDHMLSGAEESREDGLRLVFSRPRSPLTKLVDRIDEDLSRQHGELADRLAGLSEALADANADTRQEVLAQIASIRIGLRCLADAIGELAALAATLDGNRPPGGEAPEDTAA